MDGRGYLEKLIADRLGAGGGRPVDGRRGAFNLAEVRGVAIGLVAAGVLGQEEAERILADLETTLRGTGWLQVVRHEGAGTATAGTAAVAAREGSERPEWRQAIEEPPAPGLRDVVPLAGRTVTVEGVTALLVSLEVWSSFLVLNLAHIGNDPRRVRGILDLAVRWHGWDDVGTQYRAGSGSASGSSAMYVERRLFEPGPPAHARVLTLTAEHAGGRITVPIPLSADRSDPPD